MYKKFCNQCGVEMKNLSEYQHLNTHELDMHLSVKYPGGPTTEIDLCSVRCATAWVMVNGARNK